MNLRSRLALTTLCVTAPTVFGLFVLDAVARHDAAAEALLGFTEFVIEDTDFETRCEADPASLVPLHDKPPGPSPFKVSTRKGRKALPDRPHGANPVVWAYDSEGRPFNPQAPGIPEEGLSLARTEEVWIVPVPWYRNEVDVVVKASPGAGKCGYYWFRGTTVRGWLGAILPDNSFWLVPVGAIFVSILLAVGPIIRRIRHLTDAVHASAADGYVEPVELGGRDEVHELARAFNAAAQEVQAQLAEKDRRELALRNFLSDTTHDVMIPLTVLKGHLADMRERFSEGRLPDAAILTGAVNEAHYIGALLENLAVAAKLDSGQPQVHMGVVDLLALIERVMSRHRPIAAQRHIELEAGLPESPLSTCADVTMLEQAVSNIVYNAIRYNRPGGHVAVILESMPEHEFRLSVLDDGPGMSPDELSSMVERGFRGHAARTRAPGGQGLGLAIAGRVTKLHGFALHFDSSEDGGVAVEIRGPLHGG